MPVTNRVSRPSSRHHNTLLVNRKSREQVSVLVVEGAGPIGLGEARRGKKYVASQHPQQTEGRAPLNNPRCQRLFGILDGKLARFDARKAHRASDPARHPTDVRESEMDDRGEPFGMPFANREVAAIAANELNRHDRGMWFYTVERQIEGRRWIIVRDGRELDLVERHSELRHARNA
jgi:hypothetical protein